MVEFSGTRADPGVGDDAAFVIVSSDGWISRDRMKAKIVAELKPSR